MIFEYERGDTTLGSKRKRYFLFFGYFQNILRYFQILKTESVKKQNITNSFLSILDSKMSTETVSLLPFIFTISEKGLRFLSMLRL